MTDLKARQISDRSFNNHCFTKSVKPFSVCYCSKDPGSMFSRTAAVYCIGLVRVYSPCLIIKYKLWGTAVPEGGIELVPQQKKN